MAGAFLGILCTLAASADLLGIILGVGSGWVCLSKRNLTSEISLQKDLLNTSSGRDNGSVMVCAGCRNPPSPPVCERFLTQCSVPNSPLVSNTRICWFKAVGEPKQRPGPCRAAAAAISDLQGLYSPKSVSV